MNKQVITVIFIAFVFTALGYGTKVIFDKKTGVSSYEAGWEAAKKRMIDSQMCPVADEKMEIKSIGGEIKSISGNKITLKAMPVEPISDPSLDERTVDISSAKIYQLTKKDSAEYQKEIDAFVKKVSESGNQAKPAQPEFFAKKEIKISELKVGQQIIVKADQDLKTTESIKANEVDVQLVLNGK